MIERYTRPEMGSIWTLENRYKSWLDVEIAVCKAWAEKGRIPEEALQNIIDKAEIDADRILAIEEITRHDIIAFLTALEEKIGPDARFIHLGCTSSDIVDTAGSLLLVQAGKIILKDIDAVLETIKGMAMKYKGVLCMGRSHGVHAEPISFGLKMTGFYAEFARHKKRLEDAIEDIRVGKISGAVGTYTIVTPEVEEIALTHLGLKVDPHSTQIVQRDRYSHFFTTLAILGGGIERLCVELRHLQRTEVLEAEEGFAKGQASALQRHGSSGKPGPLARTRHQPLLCGTSHHARFHHSGRLRLKPPEQAAREPYGPSREHGAPCSRPLLTAAILARNPTWLSRGWPCRAGKHILPSPPWSARTSRCRLCLAATRWTSSLIPNSICAMKIRSTSAFTAIDFRQASKCTLVSPQSHLPAPRQVL